MLGAVSTHDKALQINMDATKYGTFAEIGAGQEVARRLPPSTGRSQDQRWFLMTTGPHSLAGGVR